MGFSDAARGESSLHASRYEWLSDEMMQSIASENNLSETAYLVPSSEVFHICWFSSVHKVDLSGHATLASAWALFNLLGCAREEVAFQSRSGVLTVRRNLDWMEMGFPAHPSETCDFIVSRSFWRKA